MMSSQSQKNYLTVWREEIARQQQIFDNSIQEYEKHAIATQNMIDEGYLKHEKAMALLEDQTPLGLLPENSMLSRPIVVTGIPIGINTHKSIQTATEKQHDHPLLKNKVKSRKPRVSDLLAVYYDDKGFHYHGRVTTVLTRNRYCLAHIGTGKPFEDNPIHLKPVDETKDARNTDRWHFIEEK